MTQNLPAPNRLYGRDTEAESIREAYLRVQQGTPEVLLVRGSAGIGKTFLVNNVQFLNASFIAAKFNQRQQLPYNGLVQVIQGLVNYLLSESEDRKTIWRQQILESMGQSIRIIGDVAPELESIVGHHPEVPEVPPTETKQRFNQAVQRFIQLFCQPEQPLVLFVDDLQWGDRDSLQTIQLLLSNPYLQHLLFIGAYRDSEINLSHPLRQVEEELRGAGRNVNYLTVTSLSTNALNEFLSDSLDRESHYIGLSSQLQGNPLLAVRAIHKSNLGLSFVSGRVNRSVIQHLVEDIERLPEESQEVLKIAACLGGSFTSELLATASNKTEDAVAQQLQPAIEAGLIVLSEEGYNFWHDLVEQAAYSLIDEGERAAMHLAIGRALDEKSNLFTVVNQLNLGSSLLASQSERKELATLNLEAGKQARKTAAYGASFKYFEKGVELVASWENHTLAIDLYTNAIESAYLSVNFEQFRILAETALQHARNKLEKAGIYEHQIQGLIAQNLLQEAIITGEQALIDLEIPLETELPTVTAEELENLPNSDDCLQIQSSHVLKALSTAAYIARPALLPVVVATMVRLCIEKGNSNASPWAYSLLSLIFWANGDIDSAYEIGKMSLRVLENLGAEEVRARVVDCFNAYIRLWKEHLGETVIPIKEIIEIGFKTGDLEAGGYAALSHCDHSFFTSESLQSVDKKYAYYLKIFQNMQLEYHLTYGQIGRQIVLNLLDLAEDRLRLTGDAFNEGVIAAKLQRSATSPKRLL